MKIGHFGCGTDVMKGADNFDRDRISSEVKELNMNQVPFGIKDGVYDQVVCRHVLEHLETNPLDVLMELHRVTKPGGEVVVELPIFGNLVSHQRHLHSRNYLNPVTVRKSGKNCNYIKNCFEVVCFRKTQRCSLRKMLWKVKIRFLTWVDSFWYDGYEWRLQVKK